MLPFLEKKIGSQQSSGADVPAVKREPDNTSGIKEKLLEIQKLVASALQSLEKGSK